MTLHEYLERPGAPVATALADELGCSLSHLSRLRHGQRSPSLALAIKIETLTRRRVPVGVWASGARRAA